MDGDEPQDKLTQDAEGNLYGTTLAGGNDSAGTVFEVSSSGSESVIQNFCIIQANCAYEPAGPVIRDVQGNLYGITAAGGPIRDGVIYRTAPDRTYTELSGGGGLGVGNGLVVDKAGNLYGVTIGGGTVNATVYKLTKH